MRTFKPDLIIEVTSTCNRSCTGCYAPNVVSNKSAKDLMAEKPNLFLDVNQLENLIAFWEQKLPKILSFRGGEPSLHPELGRILQASRFFASELVIETHGRWLLEDQRQDYQEVITAVYETKTVVKISYDSMHRLRVDQLLEITSFLENLKIRFYIAVTENTVEEFHQTIKQVLFIDPALFIFQKKALSSESLVRPELGVIDVSGRLNGGLMNKFDSRSNLLEVVG